MDPKTHAEIQRLGTDPDARAMIEMMKDQLLIVLILRLGGAVTVPVAEVDDTGGVVMTVDVDNDARTFKFEVKKKQ